ncbi:hypothetical protein DBK25_16300 [Salmonella enterica subsp. enterica serovar Typhi]|nr:hypothetical protein DBK25_16300 [Salmonella enterica subsp. enterica serovar Typhi]
MMKEKKTLLNNNENGTGLPSKPSIMSENKLQNTVFSAIGSASPAHKLVQGSSAAAFLKNHESLLAGTAVVAQQLTTLERRYPQLRTFICDVLAQDPRPAYRKGEETGKTYAVWLHDFNVRWRVVNTGFEVFALEPR